MSDWRERAQAHAGDVGAALGLAREFAAAIEGVPAAGVLSALAELGAGDLTVARVVEPHLDARIIQEEAGRTAEPGTWGVFAASDPRYQLRADHGADGWSLTGTKAWCSIADRLDHALVTVGSGPQGRLFAVDLRTDGVRVHESNGWVAHGLPQVTSVPVDFDAVAARPVGEPGWYVSRPGFAWGGIRVAACWLGATGALYEYLRERAADAFADDPIRLANLGQADLARWSAQVALEYAATAIDSGTAEDPGRLAARVRALVAAAAETVMTQAGHALGPAPLAFDAGYAQRVADLSLYVRQHHAERDLAALGGQLIRR